MREQDTWWRHWFETLEPEANAVWMALSVQQLTVVRQYGENPKTWGLVDGV